MFFWSLVLIAVGIFSSFIYGRSRIKLNSKKQGTKSKSLPTYYAQYVLMWCLFPALIVYFSWAIFQEQIIQNIVISNFEYIEGAVYNEGLLLAEIRNVANNPSFADLKLYPIKFLELEIFLIFDPMI